MLRECAGMEGLHLPQMTNLRPDPQHPRNIAPRKWMAAALLVLLSHAGVVQALGLGRMKVLSHVGQPFAAEIDLINASRDDLASLKVNLAPTAAYESASLRFDPALNALRLAVQRRANGTSYIRVTSLRPVHEPYLDVLVEVTGQEVKLKRAYAALLDLPEASRAMAEAAASSAAPIAAAPVARPEALPPRAPAASPAPRPQARYSTQATAPTPVTPAPAAPSLRTADVPKEPAKTVVAQAAPAAPVAAPAPAAAPVANESAPVATEPPKPAPDAAAVTPAAKPVPAAAPEASIAPPSPPSPPSLQRGGASSSSNLLLWLGGALAALLALAGGLWVWRRRVESPVAAIEPTVTLSPAPAQVVAADVPQVVPARPVAVAVPVADRFDTTSMEPSVASVTDMVDPLDEARVHIEYGQSEQAETILREALSRQPGREDILLQLLEILAQRGDKDGFNQLAGRVHKQTGGLGDAWKRVMTMGYALDPGHALYSPTGDAAPHGAELAPPPVTVSGADDLQLEDHGNSIDMEKTLVLVRPGATPAPAPAPIEPLPDINFELPAASVPAAAAPATPAATAPQDHPGLDFKIDLPGIVDVKLDDAPSAAAADSLREEVEKKLLLARAYREMGDKEGALELLREVEREGDAAQLAEMRELTQSLTQ